MPVFFPSRPALINAGRTGEATLKWYAGRASDYDTTGWQSVATRKGE